MDANVKKILADLKGRKYSPVYFLQGEETFFIDMIASYIEDHVLPEGEKGFNQVVIYGKDAPMATILTHARRFPMMAERQVIIVREAQDIPDLNKEMGARLLLDYVTKPLESTILVFCHKYKTLDKRKELGKKIDKVTTSLTTKKLYDNQLPDFVTEYAIEKKIRIDDGGVTTLCEYVGNDLPRLANEIDKLSLSAPTGSTITREQVMNQVGVSKTYNIFELQKAILNRDPLLANRIVNYFEANLKKNPLIPAVAYLFSFFSKVLVATQAEDKSEKGLVIALKISPYSARDYTLALRNFTRGQVIRNITSIKEADLKLKGVNSGSDTEGQILRELVYRIIH